LKDTYGYEGFVDFIVFLFIEPLLEFLLVVFSSPFLSQENILGIALE
jgi:hypothetical protein